MIGDVQKIVEDMKRVSPRIDFPFMPGTHIRFRFADALAACQRVSGDESANPMVLIQKLSTLDLQSVEIALQHGLKNDGDRSPVNHDFSPETWPIQAVADALISGLEVLLFGTHPEGKELSLEQKVDFVGAHNALETPWGAHRVVKEAAEEIERVESSKAESEGTEYAE